MFLVPPKGQYCSIEEVADVARLQTKRGLLELGFALQLGVAVSLNCCQSSYDGSRRSVKRKTAPIDLD